MAGMAQQSGLYPHLPELHCIVAESIFFPLVFGTYPERAGEPDVDLETCQSG